MNIDLDQIIKQLVAEFEFTNPLSDEFNEEKFLDKLKYYIENEYKDDKIVSSDKGKDTIKAILHLSQIYEGLMTKMEDLIDKINLGKLELIENIFAFTNFNYFSLSVTVTQKTLESDNKLPVDLTNSVDQKVENFMGDKINAVDAIEASVDSVVILLDIINSFNPEYDGNLPLLKENERISLIWQLILHANLFVNIESAFKYYKFEYGELTEKKGAIYFKQTPHFYYLQQMVGKERYSNLIQENLLYSLRFFDQKRTLPKMSVDNNTVHIENNTIEVDNISEANFNSVFFTYYYHLNEKKLTYFNNLTVYELLLVLSEIQTCLHNLDAKYIVDSSFENQNNSNVPIKILKAGLLQYLSKKTNYDVRLVQKILRILTKEINTIEDIWVTPFIEIDKYYYFLMSAMADAHLVYLTDLLLEKAIPVELQEKMFMQFVISEISIKRDNEYEFEIITQEELAKVNDELKSVFAIKTKNNLIILEVSLFKFPIQSIEYNESIKNLQKVSIKLNNKKQIIEKNIKEIVGKDQMNIYGVLLTNYPSLSGIIIDNNHVFDFYLLKNYFFSGELRQAKVAFSPEGIQQDIMATISYYNNETEFNENFKEFLYKPNPIAEKIRNYRLKEIRIVPKDSNPAIYSEGIETIPLVHRIGEYIEEVEYYFKQLYYFDKFFDEYSENKKFLESKINYYLPQIFNLLVFEKERKIRVDVLSRLKISGINNISYFINCLDIAVHKLDRAKIRSNKKRKTTDYNDESASEKLLELMKINGESGNLIELSSFDIKHSLDPKSLVEVIEYILYLLSSLEQKSYTEDELNNHLLLISFFISLSKGKENYNKELYSVILNFVDALNLNNYYQKARDFSEGILEYSLKNENTPLIGWLCLFKCYIKQNNVFEATYNGNLFFSALTSLTVIDDYLLLDALYNSLLFYRNFRFYKMVEQIYKILNRLDLNKYDTQKITLSYFNARLTDIEDANNLVDDVIEYLRENINEIKGFKEKGTIPWIALLYNLRNFYELGIINDFSELNNYLNQLKEDTSKNSVEDLESKFYPKDKLSKDTLKNALVKVHETRDYEDLVFELGELEILAKNAIKVSLEPTDFDTILTAGLVLNDHYLTFKNKKAQDYAPFISADLTVKEYIDSYAKDILKKIKIYENQLIYWIFDVSRDIYALQINYKKELLLFKLENWSLNEMSNWLLNISNFFFEDKKGGFFIEEQETEYIKILKETNFGLIPNVNQGVEILFYSSIKLSEFPHNLLQAQFDNKSTSYTEHEKKVQDYILNNSDFISFHSSIANIISIDWFAENCDILEIKRENFKVEAWIPIIDEDMTINIGYNKLQPIIEDQFKGKIYTDIIPSTNMNSAINIFLAHGGKGLDGFRTVYTKDVEGNAITKQVGIEKVFGKGDIAILFICNSASISKEIFSQRLNSFTNEILSLGYKAVIAPAWSLNTDIAPHWLSKFLNELENGNSISRAVQKSNLFVAKNGYSEYNGFYTPTGWATMHLFGNPNIYFKA